MHHIRQERITFQITFKSFGLNLIFQHAWSSTTWLGIIQSTPNILKTKIYKASCNVTVKEVIKSFLLFLHIQHQSITMIKLDLTGLTIKSPSFCQTLKSQVPQSVYIGPLGHWSERMCHSFRPSLVLFSFSEILRYTFHALFCFCLQFSLCQKEDKVKGPCMKSQDLGFHQ